MPIRYRNRERRLERMLSRVQAARRAIAAHNATAAEHEIWWRRHGRTLDAWRRAMTAREQRRPSDRTAVLVQRFNRWTSRLRFHPTVLRLRLECWWLERKLGRRGQGRAPRG
jgi:hypothetical protein